MWLEKYVRCSRNSKMDLISQTLGGLICCTSCLDESQKMNNQRCQTNCNWQLNWYDLLMLLYVSFLRHQKLKLRVSVQQKSTYTLRTDMLIISVNEKKRSYPGHLNSHFFKEKRVETADLLPSFPDLQHPLSVSVFLLLHLHFFPSSPVYLRALFLVLLYVLLSPNKLHNPNLNSILSSCLPPETLHLKNKQQPYQINSSANSPQHPNVMVSLTFLSTKRIKAAAKVCNIKVKLC